MEGKPLSNRNHPRSQLVYEMPDQFTSQWGSGVFCNTDLVFSEHQIGL